MLTYERYRATNQGVNENGRYCRVTSQWGTADFDQERTYQANERAAKQWVAQMKEATNGTRDDDTKEELGRTLSPTKTRI